MNEPPFWLVWCEDGGEPRCKHESQFAAEQEATRLANANPGKRFCVLPCVARYSIQRVNVERFEPEFQVPF